MRPRRGAKRFLARARALLLLRRFGGELVVGALLGDARAGLATLLARVDRVAPAGEHVFRQARALPVGRGDLHAGELITAREARVLSVEQIARIGFRVTAVGCKRSRW